MVNQVSLISEKTRDLVLNHGLRVVAVSSGLYPQKESEVSLSHLGVDYKYLITYVVHGGHSKIKPSFAICDISSSDEEKSRDPIDITLNRYPPPIFNYTSIPTPYIVWENIRHRRSCWIIVSNVLRIQRGDLIRLVQLEKEGKGYTPGPTGWPTTNDLHMKVSLVIPGSDCGVEDGYCVLQLEDVQ